MISPVYTRVIALFDDGEWTDFDGPGLIERDEILQAQMIVGITGSGASYILKNRYGNTTGRLDGRVR